MTFGGNSLYITHRLPCIALCDTAPQVITGGFLMKTDVNYRSALKEELLNLKESGVSFLIDGAEVEPGDSLVDRLLSENGYTYMRNYEFKGGKLVEIEFEKINLKQTT